MGTRPLEVAARGFKTIWLPHFGQATRTGATSGVGTAARNRDPHDRQVSSMSEGGGRPGSAQDLGALTPALLPLTTDTGPLLASSLAKSRRIVNASPCLKTPW